LYILKSYNLLTCIIKGKKFQIDGFEYVNKHNLNNYLKKHLRDNQLKKPYSKGTSFTIDGSTQIKYYDNGDGRL